MFEFMTATRIVFGNGVIQQAGSLVQSLGTRALVVSGSNAQRALPLTQQLDTLGIPYTLFSIQGEPSIERILEGIAHAKAHAVDVVIGFGGGSALDASKAIATLVNNPGDPLDYLEVIGKGNAIQERPLPTIAIPTTSGTGSEVTRNAVLSSATHRTKVSMRSPLMLPTVALVDPELTYALPPNITAYTGMDALTQVIEPYVTHASNPLTDALCEAGIRRTRTALVTAFREPRHAEARQDMALVSLLGGLALANARLGAVHGFANPIGGMFDAPHGAICGILLPLVMAKNVQKMQAEAHPRLERYDHIGQWLQNDPQALAEDGIQWVAQTVATLGIPRLSAYGVQSHDLDDIVSKSAQANSMKGNPIPLTHDDLRDILEQAL